MISAGAAAKELQIGHSRLYEIYSDYLCACAQGRSESWTPKSSGGDHRPDWPAEVQELLERLLTSKPPSSYSAAASELLRRFQFETDRASVRRWAFEHKLAPDTRYKKVRQPIKRWQARDHGALWQYDASPHQWIPEVGYKPSLLNLLDDATRINVAARLYQSETLMAHLDFLDRAFRHNGLPLALYVDYHSFFFAQIPEAFTQLGQSLRFYQVALRYAPTPQAKGKIERRHSYFQSRLPALFAAEKIFDLEPANKLLDELLPHANEHELHRELGMTPNAALKLAQAENRSVLRPAPSCPWWPFVWSIQSKVRVGDDGKVPFGQQRLPIQASPRTKIVQCLRPDGDLYFIRSSPDPKQKPEVLLHCPVF